MTRELLLRAKVAYTFFNEAIALAIAMGAAFCTRRHAAAVVDHEECRGEWIVDHDIDDQKRSIPTHINTVNSKVWHGMAWHGIAWHSIAWHSIAWHSMA